MTKSSRLYHRCKTGLRKWLSISRVTGCRVRFLTLTTNYPVSEGMDASQLIDLLHRDFDLFRKRLFRDFLKDGSRRPDVVLHPEYRDYVQHPGLSLGEYFRVSTSELYGTIHVAFVGDFLPHDVAVEIWNEVHASNIVSLEEIGSSDSDMNKMTQYLMSQYLSCQNAGIVRYGFTRNWVFPGFVGVWRRILRECRTYLNRVNEYGQQMFIINLPEAIYFFELQLHDFIFSKLGIVTPFPFVPASSPDAGRCSLIMGLCDDIVRKASTPRRRHLVSSNRRRYGDLVDRYSGRPLVSTDFRVFMEKVRGYIADPRSSGVV